MTNQSHFILLSSLLLTILLIVLPAGAVDTYKNIPLYEITNAEFFYPDNVVTHMYHADIVPHWIADDTFWYADAGKKTTDYLIVNTTRQDRALLFDTNRFVSSLASATGKTVDPAYIPITITFLFPDLSSFSFMAFGSEWTCNLPLYQIIENPLPDPVQAGIRSPDLRFIAYVNESNLYLYDTRTGSESPLTTDGTEDYFYGKRSETVSYPVTGARLHESPRAYLVWSPDSTQIRTFHVNQRDVKEFYLLEDVPQNDNLRPVLYTYRFANPGDATIPMYEPVTINILTRTITKMQENSQPEVSMMDTDEYLLQWWNDASDTIWSLFIKRGEKTLRFLTEDPKTGTVHEILQETGLTYCETNLAYASRPNIAVLSRSGDIIWFSERDGWGHLYRYDGDGTLKNQITSGEWVVREILFIDENQSTIYFTASGKEEGNPYYRYLYRVRTDGTGLQLLTPEYADHTISFSPDGCNFVDSYSRVDLPTVTYLKSADGASLMYLATTDISDLTNAGWSPPEQVSYMARDGVTNLYGLLFTPTDFDPTQSYPVVDIVYPGPYTIVTTTEFPDSLSWNAKIFWTSQMLSELGFIVVNMDGLGTAYRSKSFHDVSYGHLSDAGLPDHIAGLIELATTHQNINLSRIGIYGKSAGGFMAAQAMLTYPDFFKVGVAASGNQDSRLYGSFWGEKYEGMPDGTNYLEQVTKEKAANLSGDLLLLTGDLDDNVHPAMTMQLADALIEADKPFDMFIFTNQNHDLNYEPYYLRKMMRYFVDNL